MGMTIEEKFKTLQDEYTHLAAKYLMVQADYENRLKADLKAILVDLLLDVEGQKFDVHIDKDVWNDAIGVCSDLIQQKINSIEAESEDKDKE